MCNVWNYTSEDVYGKEDRCINNDNDEEDSAVVSTGRKWMVLLYECFIVR